MKSENRNTLLEISFGGIPNSSSLMPCLTTWAHSCSAAVLPMRTMSSPKGVQKQSHGCSCQGCKATNHALRNPPEPSGSCIRNLHQHTPEPSRTFRKLHPEPTPAHTGNTGTLRNLPEPAPEPAPAHTGTLRNLPEPASRTYTSTHRNCPEPSQPASATCLCNLHQPTPRPSKTFRNLPLEPTPAHTEPSGTFRNLPPEPAPATRTGTHRSLSGLKTPLAYAVGKKGAGNAQNAWKLNNAMHLYMLQTLKMLTCVLQGCSFSKKNIRQQAPSNV